MLSRLKEILGLSERKVQEDNILILTENQAEIVEWMIMTLQSPQGVDRWFMRQSMNDPAELVVPDAKSLEIWKNVLDCYDKGLLPQIITSERFPFEGKELVFSTISFVNQ